MDNINKILDLFGGSCSYARNPHIEAELSLNDYLSEYNLSKEALSEIKSYTVIHEVYISLNKFFYLSWSHDYSLAIQDAEHELNNYIHNLTLLN